jgi:hypothetical protein
VVCVLQDGQRRCDWLVVMVAFVIATVGCTEPDGHGGPPSRATDVAPTSVSSLASLPDEMTSALDGFTGQLVITRQRDLIDRGLINVLTMNGTADDVYITDRALVADFFENSAAPVRRSWVPPGRSVALQVPYGTTIDCTTNEPVRAHLRITYTLGDDEREQTADIALEGADILDAIRAEQCAQRTFDAATRLGFEDVAVVDQVLVATLTIARTSGESSFVIEGVNGTILIGVETDDGFQPIPIDGPTVVALPLTFVVNRCDPHALAEVTKRYGLDLFVAVDGQPAQAINVDVTALTPLLEEIVERCRQQSQ